MTTGKKKGIGGTILTAITVGSILWEERALVRRILKEAGKQINKIKNTKD